MRKYLGYISLVVIFLLLFLLFFCFCSRRHNCRSCKGDANPVIVKNWINWNILFTRSSLDQSQAIVQDFEVYLNNFAHAQDPTVTLNFNVHYCPCDSFITNIDATLISGSGKPVTPPGTKPNPGPSGDYVLSENLDLSMPDHTDSNYIVLDSIIADTSTISAALPSSRLNRTLAVIDTGLDTLLFGQGYPNAIWAGNLLWQDASKPTLFDVNPDESQSILMDNNYVKHGTAATWIALSQIKWAQPTRIPQIMSIRAFDDSERGSIYTVSCALSYAIQHHADYINASWGYYGKEDIMLKSYLLKADRQSIKVIAAAGNTPGIHDPTEICNTVVNPVNSLDYLNTIGNLFYPASFSIYMQNLVSVTQLDSVISLNKVRPCYYQNYSQNFVTVGVLDSLPRNGQCCEFHIPFLQWPIEGSSFATPTMTGILMSKMPDNNLKVKQFLFLNSSKSFDRYTNHGDYFIYTEHN
jgi:Subtilase family